MQVLLRYRISKSTTDHRLLSVKPLYGLVLVDVAVYFLVVGAVYAAANSFPTFGISQASFDSSSQPFQVNVPIQG